MTVWREGEHALYPVVAGENTLLRLRTLVASVLTDTLMIDRCHSVGGPKGLLTDAMGGLTDTLMIAALAPCPTKHCIHQSNQILAIGNNMGSTAPRSIAI